MTMVRGREWTEEENALLIEMKREGRTAQEIADALGRTEASVTFQCSKLRVKQQIILNQRSQANRAAETFDDVPVEEYSEEEMRAATKDADKPSAEPSCVSFPVIPCGDGQKHPIGKLPSDRSVSVRALERPLRDAKTVLHTVRDLVAMLHADEDRKVDEVLVIGVLLADATRLVEDLEALRG